MSQKFNWRFDRQEGGGGEGKESYWGYLQGRERGKNKTGDITKKNLEKNKNILSKNNQKIYIL